jgi:hypothetical protein
MLKLVGKVVLRNDYRILQDSDGDYRVTHEDTRGAEYTQCVAAGVVQYLRRKCRGTTVLVADARAVLEEAPPSLKRPYSYGYKLRFYAQSVLVVLVALRQARYKKSGKRFEYTILPAATRGRDTRPERTPVGGTKTGR